ncbi:MAG: RNA 2'-phosphotransferase, partial [Candidatus Kapabacteria bacterium]|nr:RNA 2'-phosphotransferase [Candidatus Kapabacteria bacterium]
MKTINKKNIVNLSKFLSLVLRHKPEEIGVTLDENGWCSVEELLQKIQIKQTSCTMEVLEYVVDTNPKQRFAFNESKTMIRANQGHSIEIDLNIEPQVPPEILYHGTTKNVLDSVIKEGLKKIQRHHVHLTTNVHTTLEVARRYGEPVLLQINTEAMHKAGHIFYCTANNVWLAESVPPEYITIQETNTENRILNGKNVQLSKKELAKQTLEILNNRYYQYNTQTIDISVSLEKCLSNTHTYSPDELVELLNRRVSAN